MSQGSGERTDTDFPVSHEIEKPQTSLVAQCHEERRGGYKENLGVQSEKIPQILRIVAIKYM